MPVDIHEYRDDAAEKRPVAQAMARGFRSRCPHCGEGKLFRAWMKPVNACAACGEDMSHQRADDAPPYITIVLVGHILVPMMLAFQFATDFPTHVYLAIYLPITAAMAVGLMQPVKGAVVGLQWALRMHGFDGSADPDAAPEGFMQSPSS